jgi:hypothetical protein
MVIPDLLGRLSGIPSKIGDTGSRLPAHLIDPYPLTLDSPFLRLSQRDVLTLRDAFEHFLSLAESGGGKTSGPLYTLLERYMLMGFGGLICTYKSDEISRVIALAKSTGREDSLVIVRPGGFWKTNLLDFELTREGQGAGRVDEATSLLMEAITNAAPKGYRESKDSIWEEAVSRLIRFSMLLLRAAGFRIHMDNLTAITDGIPSLHPSGMGLVWPSDSLVQDCLARAKGQGADVDTVKTCETFFTQQLTKPGSSRFVANVLASWQNMSDHFTQAGPVKELLFAEHPTFTPDVSKYSAIVCLGLPVAEYAMAGKVAQLTYKASFINALLRRQGLEGGRPCFLLIDEYQFLASPLDAKLMQAGRSSWVSACMLTQGIPNLYAAMEPGRAHDVVDSMLGNFGCIIGGRTKCRVTSNWLSETINRALIYRWSGGINCSDGYSSGWSAGVGGGSSEGGGSHSSNSNWSSGSNGGWSYSEGSNTGWRLDRDLAVPPETFLTLSGGGPPSYRVQTVLVKAGKRFRASGGKPYIGVSWPQH